MSFEPTALSHALPGVLKEHFTRATDGSTVYRLELGELPPECAIPFAELILPKGFPEWGIARIRLSKKSVLRVPHVESDGMLCIDGDPGPGRGQDGVQRVRTLVHNFYTKFFTPWCNGELDGDFSKEPQNYWGVNVIQLRTSDDTARKVWTVDAVPLKARVRDGVLLLPERIIIAGDDDNQFVQRTIASLGPRAKQRIRVIVADIPIFRSFMPETWPKNCEALLSVLHARLKPHDFAKFEGQSLRKPRDRIPRVVLFRNQEGGFAYVLPGGPVVVVKESNRHRIKLSHSKIQPVMVERIDPAWTVGRDQIPQVFPRQQKHVVVFGAGALGSSVVEQLAKAGIGKITLVDSDTMGSENIGRHLLGVQHVGLGKAETIARELNQRYPSCFIKHEGQRSAETWLQTNSLEDVDTVLDLTGEPEVRWHLNEARQKNSCKLLVAWMEPFVAAAHVCLLTPETLWFSLKASTEDRLNLLEAIDWPAEVIRQVPGCSSRFQAYTSANAAYAVALACENALRLIDGEVLSSTVLSWIRGQKFLDKNWPNLKHREWATEAAQHVGFIKERPFV